MWSEVIDSGIDIKVVSGIVCSGSIVIENSYKVDSLHVELDPSPLCACVKPHNKNNTANNYAIPVLV